MKQSNLFFPARAKGTLVSFVHFNHRGPCLFFLVSIIGLGTSIPTHGIPVSGDIYSQSISRPEESRDRPQGTFHETRIRLSTPLTESEIAGHPKIFADLGAYLLREWPSGMNPQQVNSPYAGLRAVSKWTRDRSVSSLSFIVEGRYRNPSHQVESERSKGWDPRVGLVAGHWAEGPQYENGSLVFLDFYGDMISASKFSEFPVSTGSLRLGTRLPPVQWAFPSMTNDLSVDLFLQDAAILDLGTRRREVRMSWAGGATLTTDIFSGNIQARIFHGWPLGDALDTSPRWEGLLVLGVSW